MLSLNCAASLSKVKDCGAAGMGYGNRGMKTIFLSSAAALICALNLSCNTTIGLGRDMRILGENMEHTANKKQGGGGGGAEYQDTGGAPVY